MLNIIINTLVGVVIVAIMASLAKHSSKLMAILAIIMMLIASHTIGLLILGLLK